MKHLLTSEQRAQYDCFIQFMHDTVVSQAARWEEEEAIPRTVIETCAAAGYLGLTLPREYGGHGGDNVSYGLLNEALGGASVSLSGLINVHTMVAQTLLKWGSTEQKQRWLPKLANGQLLSAFAITEPEVGSDIQHITSRYTRNGNDIQVSGTKKWITFAGVADLFLVFGKLDGESVAAIIEKGTPGLHVKPIRHMLGFKAAHLAQLELNDCRIPAHNLIGKPGFALSYIAPYALEYGRISVAFAALGILRACLEICGKHTLDRVAFDAPLIEHGVVSELITDMGVDYEAATLLCLEAVKAKDSHIPDATEKILIAKYFTSRASARHASHAVQIMGAIGCNEDYPLARFYRDTKTMEIIEGSSQIHQLLLGKSFARAQKNKHTTQEIKAV